MIYWDMRHAMAIHFYIRYAAWANDTFPTVQPDLCHTIIPDTLYRRLRPQFMSPGSATLIAHFLSLEHHLLHSYRHNKLNTNDSFCVLVSCASIHDRI